MRKLHHWMLDPFSRSIRVLLREKQLDCDFETAEPWDEKSAAKRLNPLGGVPVLEDMTADGILIVAEPRAILEYLDETYPDPPLTPGQIVPRSETRWVMGWLERGFDLEVNQTLLNERILQRVMRSGTPNTDMLRKGSKALAVYMRNIEAMTAVRPYLSGDSFSLADICLASHLSCHDYFNDVPWSQYPMAADWYIRMKSRSSFREILQDRVSGVEPAENYSKLDF